MQITLTDAAKEAIKKEMEKKGETPLFLRLKLRPRSGCCGVELGAAFDAPKNGDQQIEVEGIPINVQEGLAQFIGRIRIDYKSDRPRDQYLVTGFGQGHCGSCR